MAYWPMPAGTTGGMTVIRTNLAAARADRRDCPLARSSKARPLLRPTPALPEAGKPLQGFTLKVLMDALDLIECDRHPVQQVIERMWRTRGTFGLWRRPPAHPGLLEWTAGVISRYLAARKADQQSVQLAGLRPTHPVRDNWVAQQRLGCADSRGAEVYEQTAWGRRYAALDGSARDLWLLSFGRAKEDRPPAEKAAAAYTATFGRPCTGGRDAAHEPVKAGELHPGRMAAPHHVRVIEFGCGDGRSEVLLNWDREKVTRHFADDARPVLAEVIDDSRAVPGSSCVECKALAGCTTLIRAENLLPLPPLARPAGRRSVSAADLRSYRDCPAKYHLTRQLKLVSPREQPAEIRGRAVDAWLNERHLARPPGGCRMLPGPANPSAWSAGEWPVSGQEAEDGAGMLAQHAAVCPLDGLDDSDSVLVQQHVVCYDPRLDLVLIAVPDLLHTRGGGWVWRETKTSTSPLYEGEPLLLRYPQLAFGVVMLATGVLGGKLSRSRVELELLHPDDLSFEELDPSRPQVVSDARDVLADLATPWAQDSVFHANPGRYCHNCEALDWCRPGRDHLSATAVAAEDR